MSADEDYPNLASQAWYVRDGRHHHMTAGLPAEARRALNEIDNLRDDVTKLLGMLAQAGVEWPT